MCTNYIIYYLNNMHFYGAFEETLKGIETWLIYLKNASLRLIIIITAICNWRRNTAMPLQGRLTVN